MLIFESRLRPLDERQSIARSSMADVFDVVTLNEEIGHQLNLLAGEVKRWERWCSINLVNSTEPVEFINIEKQNDGFGLGTHSMCNGGSEIFS